MSLWRTQDGGSCPQWGAWAGTALSSVMEPRAERGGLISAVKHPMPTADSPVPALPRVTSGGRGIWAGAARTLLSPVPAEPGALGCQHSQPICSRGALPAHHPPDNCTPAKGTCPSIGGLDTLQNPSPLSDC